MGDAADTKLANDAFAVTVRPDGRQINLWLVDRAMDFELANAPYRYRARRGGDEGSILSEWLVGATVTSENDAVIIRGRLAGLELEHSIRLPSDRQFLEERLTLRNPTDSVISLIEFVCGMQRRITDVIGRVLPELGTDHIIAIPFRHRPDRPHEADDFAMEHLLTVAGREPVISDVPPLPGGHGYLPSNKRFSEGWAWRHGDHTLGVFKFNQDAIEFSVLAIDTDADGATLCFAGAGLARGSSALDKIQPGETIELGVTRLQTVRGDYSRTSYAFRAFLDEHGCRFPAGYDPPVHWNELYDNPEWHVGSPGTPPGRRMTRPFTYTREMILAEAAKAQAYHCESLYLDPGWDTEFATLLWGEEWLGDRRGFIQEVRERYGLCVSLHCPLATWLTLDGRGVADWPEDSYRMDAGGAVIYEESWNGGQVGSVCLGSRQYLDEAEERLLAHCADGVVFLMFDGNMWNQGCWNPDHGHPVPYTRQDHCLANVELARRIHGKYPEVLIEMHDMLSGGAIFHATPVYYQYGLPGSFDENWGFELMWQPMEDLLSGRACSLYYYNLGCNVPIYLHVDLRGDNEHALVFWWYASACRHLGIGGTHDNPVIAEAHRQAMQRYRRLDRFYKRGDFYGINEEVHVHTLPDENALVVNLFNLSGESRIITGTISAEEMGIDPNRWYVTTRGVRLPETWQREDSHESPFTISRRLAPWSAQVAEVLAFETDQ